MIKKESRQFNISVEGINCEKMYFEHLARLINSSDSTCNLKVDPRKMSPMQYARRNAHKPVEKRKGNKKLPYIHVQDIEDYYSEFHRNKFFGILVTLDSIKQAIRRAEKIVEQNAQDRKASENYRGVTFYHDNPDVSVHEVVRLIFEVCEVKQTAALKLSNPQ